MIRGLMFVQLLAAAGFGGGCLLLSVMLGALRGLDPAEGAQIMHTLLPRMGSVMAPLLVIALGTSLVLGWLSTRAQAPNATAAWIAAGAFATIAIVTAVVHLPLNAQLLGQTSWSAALASSLLERWLLWHHLRTALAAVALGALLWATDRPRPWLTVAAT